MEKIYLLLIVLVAGVGLFSIYLYWIKRENAKESKWGINFTAIKPGAKINCPSCGSELPRIRKPGNLRQFLWGGFTCKSCSKEYDKWLNEIHS
jgi:DNA-directed RNA polymerase subunit RPC12/RpoP